MKKKTSNDFIKVTSFTVANVRIVKTKAGKELIFFTLTINEKDYVRNSTTVNVGVTKVPTEIRIQNDYYCRAGSSLSVLF